MKGINFYDILLQKYEKEEADKRYKKWKQNLKNR